MTVLHTVDSIRAEKGGPSRSVPALVRALNDSGVDTRLHAADRDGRLPWSGADILHDHGIWLPSNHRAAANARRCGLPFIVSPRGMIEPWSMAHRWMKKRVAWTLYQRRDLASAVVLHATSGPEVESVRRLGFRQPVALVPNGVDVPDPLPPRSQGPARRALFLSRIHLKKGLPLLVEAWRRLRPVGWELCIAGPDEGGHQATIEAQVRAAGLSDVVHFVGPVADADKWALYRTADLFVLPTHTENFGIVIAEALGAGVPVLTTKGAPWRELDTHGCGWWTDVSVDAIAAALTEATQTSRADLDAMGVRGRALVLEHYGWDDVARQMKAVYEWILGTGDRLPYVHLD